MAKMIYKVLLEKYTSILENEGESAPYGFMIWYDGTVDEVYRMDEHREILQDNLGKLGRMLTMQQRRELSNPSDTDLWRLFFKSGCVRMVRDHTGNYLAEGSFRNNKVTPRIKKICQDEAGMYRRSITFVEPASLYLTEEDKEDIMAGLEEIEQTSAEFLADKIYKKFIELKGAEPVGKTWWWVDMLNKYVDEIIKANRLDSFQANMGGSDNIDLKGFIWHYISAMYSHPSMTDKFKDKIRHFIQQAIDRRDGQQ